MDADLKKILKAVVLEMRHELEGYYDIAGKWHPGDLETRLAEIGVRKDRASVPVDELGRLIDEDVRARKIVDAFIDVREQAGVDRAEAVAEYVRESAYTWANRLVALRCMEARELMDDEVIVGREAYGGRSLVHHRLAQSSPELCTGEDDGRFAMLAQVFAERSKTLPMLFDPDSPSIALRPSPAALKNCLAWLSGTQKARSQEPATDAVFAAPDALGWAYQYWNTEEKDRVFEMVRTKKGAKIEGADIIPATQLYTEDYMVKFLVQNSLGATWMGMHPESKLFEDWEYYVRDADRAPVKTKPLQQITLLDPACGSGHFLIEAFDMFYTMYEEEGSLREPEAICRSILENNLFGIDIDERAIQIAEASLWMKAGERAFEFTGANTNLVAATSSHLKGDSWERYLAKLKNEPSTVRVLRRFAVEMEHIDELGSLARPAEALESIINEEHEIWEKQERERREADKSLFQEIRDDLLASQLPFQDISDKEFFERTMRHALFAIDGFTAEARESGEFNDQLVAIEAKTGFRLLNLLERKYDLVVANPPYMGMRLAGPSLQSWSSGRSEAERRDLFSAFIVRGLSVLTKAGRISFITPHSWMFLSTFESLRETMLSEGSIEAMAHLGPRTFPDLSNTNAFGFTMFTWSKGLPSSAVARYFRLVHEDDKQTLLRSAVCNARRNELSDETFDFSGDLVKRMPSSVFFYWAPNTVRKLFEAKDARFVNLGSARQGLITGDNERFLRFWWETSQSQRCFRWPLLYKGGSYRRWHGNEWYAVDWQREGVRIRNNRSASGRLKGRPQNTMLFGRAGGTWTAQSSYGFSVRMMARDAIFSDKGPAFFAESESDLHFLIGICNSYLFEFLFLGVQPTVDFGQGYLESLPIPYEATPSEHKLIETITRLAVLTKSQDSRGCIIEYSFDTSKLASGVSFRDAVQKLVVDSLKLHADVSLLETALNLITNRLYGLNDNEMKRIERDAGAPFLFNPFVGRTPKIEFSTTDCSEIQSDLMSLIRSNIKCIAATTIVEELTKELFEAGIAGIEETEDESEEESDEPPEDRMSRSTPVETLLERIALKAGIHPLSALELIIEGASRHSWRCKPEEMRIGATFVERTILQLLGHRWPRQIEEGYEIPVWADDDGIIPLIELEKETTLHARVLERFRKVQLDVSDFSDVMERSVEDWINTEFFKNHVRQFKKRPIVWQLQTSSFTARKSPVFACVIYYHCVDVDAIAKIRAQYTGALRLRFETEMRGILSTPVASRSDNQARRSVELEEAIRELQAFDEKLASVAQTGFGPDKLLPAFRQNALDDAMLSMKACWLKRLSVLLKQSHGEEAANGVRNPSPLDDWLDQANKTELHQDLPAWIAEALFQLSYFCSQVGPKAPDAKQTPKDPTAEDFGSLIQAEIASMQSSSMKLACGVWWGKCDAAVLVPIRERIKTLKAEQKELNAAIKEDRQPVMVAEQILEGSGEDGVSEVARVTNDMPLFGNDPSFEQTTELTKAAMKARLKEVKAKIKKFTEEMDSKAGKAQAIRDTIQAWRLPDPIPASLDFSPSSPNLPPLFDQVSSLDERRSPPKTIAEFIAQESLYAPDINDGVRVNIAPLQKAGVLAADVLAPKDVDKAIADRAEWRADERRWVREGKLPQPGWWKVGKDDGGGMTVEETDGSSAPTDGVACKQFVSDGKEDK